jgi:hypothetical protein
MKADRMGYGIENILRCIREIMIDISELPRCKIIKTKIKAKDAVPIEAYYTDIDRSLSS